VTGVAGGGVTAMFAWVATMDEVDQRAFYADLAAAATAAGQTGDPGEVERCIRQWRLTAEGMTNAELRDRLLDATPPES
jgi:hypothetical protein